MFFFICSISIMSILFMTFFLLYVHNPL
jgi:hypothetical protein